MKFARSLSFAARMVALSGLVSVLMTREAADWLVLPAAALAILGITFSRASELRLPKDALTGSVIAAFAFSLIDFYYIGGSLIVAGADLLVILLALKLLSLEAAKDYVQLFVVSFFLLLASTGLSTEFYFFIAFLMFFISLHGRLYY